MTPRAERRTAEEPNYVVSSAEKKAAWSVFLENPGLKRFLKRRYRSRGVQVYPDVRTDDRSFLRMIRELVQRLNSRLKVTQNDDGTVGPNAVASDFNRLLTVAGYEAQPRSVPPVDNSELRRSLGLLDDFKNERHRAIFDALWDAMFSKHRRASVSIRKAASSCAPDFVNGLETKIPELLQAIHNIDEFLGLFAKNKLRDLYKKFNAAFYYIIGKRVQSDSVTIDEHGVAKSKTREVNDELAARSGLTDGNRRPANKTVTKDGVIVDGHFAMRVRNVWGFGFVPNHIIATFFACWRAVYLHTYEFTWKHRRPVDILAKMSKFKYIVGFDVKAFDESVGGWMLDAFADRFAKVVGLPFANFLKACFHAPYVVPYPYADSDRPFDPLFGDDPMDVTKFTNRMGLPSGISCNPDVGKFLMTWQYLCLIDDYFHNVLEIGLDVILKGNHDQYALLNMGDDCVALTNDILFMKYLSEEQYEASYFAVSKESPISFLGNVPYRRHDGALGLAPNIESFFSNWLVPEHGIDSPMRRDFWAIGDVERRTHYGQAPSYSEAWAVYSEVFEKHIGITPNAITAQSYADQSGGRAVTDIDALVLQKPDYLHYRFEASEVSPEVLDLIQSSIPANDIYPFISHMFVNEEEPEDVAA